MTGETPRGRGFRQAVLGDLDQLAAELEVVREGARLGVEVGSSTLEVARQSRRALDQVDETLARLERVTNAAAVSDPIVDAYREHVVTRRVVVNLTTGSAIAGVLLRAAGPLLELADAEYIDSSGKVDPAPIDGRAVVERDRVEFIQIV